MRYLVVLLLAGCATAAPVDPTARFLTIEHGSLVFNRAMVSAQEHCARQGRTARHLGTDRGDMMLSRFECVDR